MLITVTKEDIKNGWNKTASDNSIALAIKRAFPKSDVIVTYWVIAIDDDRYITSQKIRKFFDKTNEGVRIRPFSFDLETLEFWYETH